MRRSEEAFGTPEGIVEVSPVAFKLRSQAAVDNGGASRLAKEIPHQRRRRWNVKSFHLIRRRGFAYRLVWAPFSLFLCPVFMLEVKRS